MKKTLFILLACLTMACNACVAQNRNKTYNTQDIYGSWVIIGLWDNGTFVSTLGATSRTMGIMFRGNACYITMGEDVSCYDFKIANGNLVKAYLEGNDKPSFTLRLLSVKRGQEIIGIMTFCDDNSSTKVKLANVFME